jgi:hypothetical protein
MSTRSIPDQAAIVSAGASVTNRTTQPETSCFSSAGEASAISPP